MEKAKLPSKTLKAGVLADLMTKIETGAYPPGALLPPEMELAEQYQVSRGTVREAMRKLAELRLIHRQPGKGTFVTPPPTATAARKETRLVGFVAPSAKDSLLVNILHGAEQVLRKENYNLVYCSSNSDLALEINQFENLIAHKVSGIILFPLAEHGEQAVEKMAQTAGVPLVLVDRHIPGCNIVSVMANHRESAYQGVKHLLSLGHRRIACISHPSNSSSVAERIAGYEQAMRETSLLPLATIQLLGIGTVVAENAPPVFTDEELVYVDHMLNVPERPTAVFCINDYVAIRVSQFILAKGYKIPEDIAVVGFDNNPFAQFAPVPLTTLAQPSMEIGATAARLLLEMCAGQPAPFKSVRLNSQLIIRASSIGNAVSNKT